MKYYAILMLTAISIACSNDHKCDLEIPNLEAQIVRSDGEKRIIKIGIDNNDFHRFMDGDQLVKIIPYYYRVDRILYVDRKSLFAYDTLDSESIQEIAYRVLMPSPKGGDLTINKVFTFTEKK